MNNYSTVIPFTAGCTDHSYATSVFCLFVLFVCFFLWAGGRTDRPMNKWIKERLLTNIFVTYPMYEIDG